MLLALVAVGLPVTASASPAVSAQDPWISAVTPNVGPESGGATVTVSGKHFTGVTTVRFGGDPGTHLDVTSDTSLTVQTPAHDTGTYRVRLIAPGRSSARTARSIYTFVTTPDVTDVDPPVGTISGGTTVTVTGDGFTDATAVRFNGVPGTDLDVQDDSNITVTTPAGTAGDARVRVIKRGSSSERSDAATFTYDATPTVTALTPSAGGIDQPSEVTIAGAGFVDVQGVSFGSVPASSYEVVSSTEIHALVDAQAAGAVDVTVETAAGTTASSSASSFTFVGTPSVNYYGLTPSSGVNTGGTVVQVQGHNFTGLTAVKLGGIDASFTVDSDSQITMTTPASATTGYANIEVVGPNGSATTYWAFQYGAAPTITTISPSSGSTSGWTSRRDHRHERVPAQQRHLRRRGHPVRGRGLGQLRDGDDAVDTPVAPVDVVVMTPFGNVTLPNGYTYVP